ncbi:MAG: hypothetical protein Q4B23_02150 [Helcococcus sp.]|nr:hypothetical protein [Helcococcus sp.]
MIKTMLPIALTLATLNPINANVNSNNTNSNIDFTSRSIISEIQNNPNVIIKEKEEKTPEKPEVTVELNKSQIKEVNGIELVVYDITDIFNKFKEEYKDKDLEVKVKEEICK